MISLALQEGSTASQKQCAQHKKVARDISSKNEPQLRINVHSGFLVPVAPSFSDEAGPPTRCLTKDSFWDILHGMRQSASEDWPRTE